MSFSSLQRSEIKESLVRERFDLTVIGGGITGAGIALDAAARGMKVALVEMQDFAAGTSSRSTKLVHGGLRYLKQLEVKMVAEVGKEREIVYENGPHVTNPERMLLPIHKGGSFGKFSTSAGLWVYDFLAGVKKTERRKMLSASQTLEVEPLINRKGLKGGGCYVEYRTDDARLTIEVMKKAIEHGALALNYVKAERFIYDENKKVKGIHARDVFSGEVFEIHSEKVVNASGPWVDEVRKKDYSTNNKKLRHTKGVHIVIDQEKFPLKQAVYFDTPDGRMVFAIPREGKAYVGTTDTFFEGDTSNPKVTEGDRNYLLECIHYMFPGVKIAKEDVESSWSGIRPLIYEEGKDPSEISRKDEIWEGESGLVTIAGGKLTGYRKMAEDVTDLIANRLQQDTKKTFPASSTKQMTISGGDVGGSAQFQQYIDNQALEAGQFGLSVHSGRELVQRYGSNAPKVFKIARSFRQVSDKSLPAEIYAMLLYSIKEEMTVTPLDFFVRRTGKLFFDIQWVKQWKKTVVDVMATVLEWKPELKRQFLIDLDNAIRDAEIPMRK
ncbi:glycerol-3-phosphate dehydrogenase/oxidase [Bacillus sp. SCS-153A]|uniref:glycerol-3-phosphate dehydrogenase/oxidase n=1 Tax=Rossellomorea sedimentorum TaxID=3115294 RepID=UPI00390641E6